MEIQNAQNILFGISEMERQLGRTRSRWHESVEIARILNFFHRSVFFGVETRRFGN
jgi:hypothetical protein